jgi:predicted nuclease of predicted toxin-antitoxin system
MKFLIDMNLKPEPAVDFLPGQPGVRSSPLVDSRSTRAADSEILDFAAANGWIVFTHDLDFGMLLAALRTNKPSVIQVRSQDVLPSAIGDLVLRAIQTAEQHLEAGALVTVDSFRHRIRLLPI